MSFDLAIWPPPVPPETDRQAAARYRTLRDDDAGPRPPTHPALIAFHRDLTARFPDGDVTTHASADAVLVTIPWSRAGELAGAVRETAARHGLMCHNPRTGETHHPSPAGPTLSSCDGTRGVVAAPAVVDREVRRLSPRNWFVIVERDDAWAQVGYGPRAGARPGWYALEHHTGAGHRRTDFSDLAEVIVALQGFARGDEAWSRRFAWNRIGPDPPDPARSG
jgi:hypothetical protein